MQQKQKWVTLSVGLIYFIAAMWIMIYASMHRVVRIEDVAQEQRSSGTVEENKESDKGSWKTIEFIENMALENDIIIPLDQEIKAENVIIENHYMDKELWIGIEGIEKKYFADRTLEGNTTIVQNAYYGKQKGTVWLKFELDGVYECQSILEDNHLYIELVKPKEIYDTVIVIDPWYSEEMSKRKSGMTEQEITLDIAERVEEKMASMDTVKVYFTRVDEEMPTLEQRQQIITEAGADFYIGIELKTSEDTSVYGVETIYNGTYFIPYFGNVELADSLEKNVTLQVSGRANGLTQAGEEDIIVQKARIPAVILKAGYLSNEKEAALLNTEEYRDRIAEGIVMTVQEACEMRAE